MADIFDRMAEAWPGPGFTRSDAQKFTGGIIGSKTLANLHSLGEGPPVLKLRGKAFYEKRSFIAWLRKHCAEGRG